MEYTSLIDTSLDLNIKPLRLVEDGLGKQEVQNNFIDLLERQIPVKEESGALLEELNRVSAENKKLTQMLTVMCENYDALRKHMVEYMSNNQAAVAAAPSTSASKKRKVSEITTNNNNNNINNETTIVDATNNGPSESSSSDDASNSKKPREEHNKSKISRVYVRTEASDTTSLIVKDGYQWRKYGQKVTRDNPSPRAYFKCSFAPSCPVKKKVQRSVDDQSILVATYEGEHNHPHPSKMENTSTTSTLNRCVTTIGSVPSSSGPTITLDLTKQKSQENGRSSPKKLESSIELQSFFIEQMASSFTKDPSFKAALAAAISGKFLQHNNNNQTENW